MDCGKKTLGGSAEGGIPSMIFAGAVVKNLLSSFAIESESVCRTPLENNSEIGSRLVPPEFIAERRISQVFSDCFDFV